MCTTTPACLTGSHFPTVLCRTFFPPPPPPLGLCELDLTSLGGFSVWDAHQLLLSNPTWIVARGGPSLLPNQLRHNPRPSHRPAEGRFRICMVFLLTTSVCNMKDAYCVVERSAGVSMPLPVARKFFALCLCAPRVAHLKPTPSCGFGDHTFPPATHFPTYIPLPTWCLTFYPHFLLLIVPPCLLSKCFPPKFLCHTLVYTRLAPKYHPHLIQTPPASLTSSLL